MYLSLRSNSSVPKPRDQTLRYRTPEASSAKSLHLLHISQEPPAAPPAPEEEKVVQPAQVMADKLKTALTAEVESPPAKEQCEEEHGFRCRGCNARIFCGTDILSSNYQAMTGPGYLVDATQNTTASEERQTVMYTTGSYVICEVSCEFCENKLVQGRQILAGGRSADLAPWRHTSQGTNVSCSFSVVQDETLKVLGLRLIDVSDSLGITWPKELRCQCVSLYRARRIQCRIS
eukprot:s2925_g4.t1